ELALHQLAHELDAAVGQRVDVVGRLLSVVKTNQLGNNGDEVVQAHHTVFDSVRHVQVQALVDLVAANAAEVEALEVVEHVFDQGTGVVDGCQVARTQATVHL